MVNEVLQSAKVEDLAKSIEEYLSDYLEAKDHGYHERSHRATIAVLALELAKFRIANHQVPGAYPDYASQAERQK
jgi:hypothetical protein